MVTRQSGRGSVARAPGYQHRRSVSARMTCRQSRNFQRTWHFFPRMNILANFATIDSRMIKSAFFCLKMKTIADNPQDAGRIDARETLTFHPHQVKQRACRQLRNKRAGSRPAQHFRAPARDHCKCPSGELKNQSHAGSIAGTLPRGGKQLWMI